MRVCAQYAGVSWGRPVATRHRGLRMLLALALLFAVPRPCRCVSAPKPSQFEVEAAYLFNFGKFVNWPQGRTQTGPFAICVLGEDPFGAVLAKTIAGETINGRAVEERRIARAQDASSCSIVYISTSESSRLSKIFSALKSFPVLTVSDMPDFLEQGGMIQFVVRDGRVRFEVNLTPAEEDGLGLSSELLKVAVDVQRRRGGQK